MSASWRWPLTAQEADDRRAECAAYLRELAGMVERREVDFLAGDVIKISVEREPPLVPIGAG